MGAISPAPATNMFEAFPTCWLTRDFGRAHPVIFLGLYVAFAALTAIAVGGNPGSNPGDNATALASLGAMTGPFTGSIPRHDQSSCLQVSLG